MRIIGIDPGTGGAFATITEDKQVYISKMPNTYKGILTLVKNLTEGHENFVFIERVHTFPTDKDDDRFMRMDALIGNQAAVIMALISQGVPFIQVASVSWQKYHGLQNKKGEKLDYNQKKKRNHQKAEKHYPGVAKYAADALLIAIYGLAKSKEDMFINNTGETNLNIYPQKK